MMCVNQAEHEDALLHWFLICRIRHIMASNKMFLNNILEKNVSTNLDNISANYFYLSKLFEEGLFFYGMEISLLICLISI